MGLRVTSQSRDSATSQEPIGRGARRGSEEHAASRAQPGAGGGQGAIHKTEHRHKRRIHKLLFFVLIYPNISFGFLEFSISMLLIVSDNPVVPARSYGAPAACPMPACLSQERTVMALLSHLWLTFFLTSFIFKIPTIYKNFLGF